MSKEKQLHEKSLVEVFKEWDDLTCLDCLCADTLTEKSKEWAIAVVKEIIKPYNDLIDKLNKAEKKKNKHILDNIVYQEGQHYYDWLQVKPVADFIMYNFELTEDELKA